MITLNVQRTHDEEQFSVRGGCGRGIEISKNLKVMCGEGEERKENIFFFDSPVGGVGV